jgi:hypothetical protein
MWKRLALVDMNSPKRIMHFQYSDKWAFNLPQILNNGPASKEEEET